MTANLTATSRVGLFGGHTVYFIKRKVWVFTENTSWDYIIFEEKKGEKMKMTCPGGAAAALSF